MPHNDNNELEALHAEVADLKRRLDAHENARTGAVDKLAGIDARLAHMQDYVAAVAPAHPVVVARQEEGLMPKMAILMTRQTGLEAAFDEMRGIVVDLIPLVRDNASEVQQVRELLERFNRRIDGLPE